MSEQQRPMTAGDLKKAIAELPDDMPLVNNNELYWEHHFVVGLPQVTEIAEFNFVEGGVTELMRAEDLELGNRHFVTKPTVVRKFTALKL